MINNRKKLRIHVLYGGNSAERPGSILSGKTIESTLRRAGYENVTRYDITSDSVFSLVSNKPDLAFLTFHGGMGEDGTLQALLELLRVPYTSSGVSASAISADKVLFNRFVTSLGYNAPDQFLISSINKLEEKDWEYPLIIKPVKQGCSYGVFLVQNLDELKERANFSLQFDGRIVVEKYIEGREFSVGIFEYPKTKHPIILPISETKLSKGILDFETKYPGGEHLYKTIIPAELSVEEREQLEDMCKNVFTKLDCRGYVRMDLRLDVKGQFYFLENNTIPGILSPTESDIPKMLNVMGISLEKFVDMIAESTLIHHYQKKNVNVPSEKEMVKYLGLKLAED